MHYALGTMHYALGTMHYALGTMHYALPLPNWQNGKRSSWETASKIIAIRYSITSYKLFDDSILFWHGNCNSTNRAKSVPVGWGRQAETLVQQTACLTCLKMDCIRKLKIVQAV